MATTTFLTAGAGAGAPNEKGSFFEELAAGVSHEKKSDPDLVPGAGALNANGSLAEDGAEVPQPLELLLKKSVALFAPVFPEEANGSVVAPHADLVVEVVEDVPKGSALLVVLELNGSFVLVLAKGSLVLVEPNGSA